MGGISFSELGTLIHGLVGFMALYLLAFTGGMVSLWNLRPQRRLPTEAIRDKVKGLIWASILMAALFWVAVLMGTFMVYPKYRAAPPQNIDPKIQTEELRFYPHFWLIADEQTAYFDTFGMAWKERISFIGAFLSTALAFAIHRYREQIGREIRVWAMLMTTSALGFFAIGIGGIWGTLLTRVASLR